MQDEPQARPGLGSPLRLFFEIASLQAEPLSRERLRFRKPRLPEGHAWGELAQSCLCLAPTQSQGVVLGKANWVDEEIVRSNNELKGYTVSKLESLKVSGFETLQSDV